MGEGNRIGNDVTLYCNASIIGALNIGDNVIIGAHVMVSKDIAANTLLTDSSEIKEKSLR